MTNVLEQGSAIISIRELDQFRTDSDELRILKSKNVITLRMNGGYYRQNIDQTVEVVCDSNVDDPELMEAIQMKLDDMNDIQRMRHNTDMGQAKVDIKRDLLANIRHKGIMGRLKGVISYVMKGELPL